MWVVHVGGTRGSGIVSSAEYERCVWLGATWVEREVSGYEDWVWALPILWEQGECWTYVCVNRI